MCCCFKVTGQLFKVGCRRLGEVGMAGAREGSQQAGGARPVALDACAVGTAAGLGLGRLTYNSPSFQQHLTLYGMKILGMKPSVGVGQQEKGGKAREQISKSNFEENLQAIGEHISGCWWGIFAPCSRPLVNSFISFIITQGFW